MLAQELDDRVHAMVLGPADHRAARFFLRDEAGANQSAQMKGERRGRYVEAALDIGDVEAVQSGPNQEPINVQSGQIAQFGQATRSELAIHACIYGELDHITTINLVI